MPDEIRPCTHAKLLHPVLDNGKSDKIPQRIAKESSKTQAPRFLVPDSLEIPHESSIMWGCNYLRDHADADHVDPFFVQLCIHPLRHKKVNGFQYPRLPFLGNGRS